MHHSFKHPHCIILNFGMLQFKDTVFSIVCFKFTNAVNDHFTRRYHASQWYLLQITHFFSFFIPIIGDFDTKMGIEIKSDLCMAYATDSAIILIMWVIFVSIIYDVLSKVTYVCHDVMDSVIPLVWTMFINLNSTSKYPDRSINILLINTLDKENWIVWTESSFCLFRKVRVEWDISLWNSYLEKFSINILLFNFIVETESPGIRSEQF